VNYIHKFWGPGGGHDTGTLNKRPSSNRQGGVRISCLVLYPADTYKMIDMDHEWNPEDIGNLVGLEKSSASEGDTDLDIAKKVLDGLSIQAVYALQHLALYSQDERVRLAAAKDILDRTVGRASTQGSESGAVDPLTKFLKSVASTNGGN
jgi:hypothetical protein